jgi:hypothetical protein
MTTGVATDGMPWHPRPERCADIMFTTLRTRLVWLAVVLPYGVVVAQKFNQRGYGYCGADVPSGAREGHSDGESRTA